ncbi:MAG TPA: metallophosphoesterase [Sphingomicrobium sp.]|nr:metallophosphoesterase [Sphingomicrobium sp.]
MQTRFPAALLPCALMSLAPIALPASAAAQTSIKFAAFGDIGNTSNSAEVARLVRNRGAELILMLGDLCYGSVPIAIQINANYLTEKANGKLRPALGNHEFSDACGGNAASGYRAYFSLPGNERYYEFKRGPVHFFAINSEIEPDGHSATSKQALWLKSRLAASTSPWQIVFFHRAPYSSGSEHGSTRYMQWPFEAWGVDAVLAAHDHDYERIIKDANGDGVKMPYFVSGLGGKSRRSFGTIVAGSVKRYNSAYGALFVTATATSMKFEFRRTGGTLIDSYTKTKSSSTTQTNDAFEFRVPPQE